MWVLKVLLCVALTCNLAAGHGPKCKDDNGNDVDWHVLYKLPRTSEWNHTPKDFSNDGTVYVSMDPSSGKWILPDKTMESQMSPPGQIYNYIIKNKKDLTYVFYNDQLPGESHGSKAHAKGILAFGKDTGIWVIHSIPHFTPDPDSGEYSYPESGHTNGQVFFCITLPRSAANSVAYQLRVMSPYVYGYHVADYEPDKRSHLVMLAEGRWLRGAPKTKTFQMKSLGNAEFISFSKSKKFREDLFDNLLAPNLKVGLFANTWLNGAGGREFSDCDNKYAVNNVLELNVPFVDGGTNRSESFPTTRDHSKWAISSVGDEPWVCVADNNRMFSQEKRGGGAVCWKSNPSWKAFGTTVSDIEGCVLDGQPYDCNLDKAKFIDQGVAACRRG